MPKLSGRMVLGCPRLKMPLKLTKKPTTVLHINPSSYIYKNTLQTNICHCLFAKLITKRDIKTRQRLNYYQNISLSYSNSRIRYIIKSLQRNIRILIWKVTNHGIVIFIDRICLNIIYKHLLRTNKIF